MKRVYLSSSFSARESGDENLLQLRLELRARAGRLGVDLVLGEMDPEIGAAAARGDHMAILEGCARLMSACDAFFGMLFERHGTKVVLSHEPVEARAEVSFFETELLEASLTAKPVCVVHLRGMTPSVSMQAFLRLVTESLGQSVIEIERNDLSAVFDDFCRALACGRAAGSPWLFDPVSVGRLRRAVRGETRDPKLSFLGGVLRESGDAVPEEAVIAAAVARVESGIDDQGRALGQLAKLSYLWIAIRELAKASAAFRTNELGGLASRTLSLWNSSAAWYGLHGAHPMGCLAALNELEFMRSATGQGERLLGPRASAYYSIGGRLRSPAAARRFYRQCLALAHSALRRRPADPSGVLQMTAHANARLALLGERWRYFAALNEFKRSLDWRVSQGASDQNVGEAMNAYGHALFELPWRRREALALAAEGVQLIRQAPRGQANGFYFRAAHKHAQMLARAGRKDEALRVAQEARDLALFAQAFDQIRQLQAVIEALTPHERETR
jgi:tetratricopeptide (TPR) repeat protein